MSDRWRQRRRRSYEWLNRLDRAYEPRNSLDEMLRRALGYRCENFKTGECRSGRIDSVPRSHQRSSPANDKRELLVDVFEDEKGIVVVTELIGIDKGNVDLHATQDKLTISVDSADCRYRKEIELPARVEVGSSSSRLKNGVLEIQLKKLGEELVAK